ncbi:spermidine/putrescine ABC transporter substrate-binding protein, partial [Streptomyces sp. MBT70]|nr:spermidine/putrescine ABC transporter substrate-binding protein [Streptomyces sp. MBT70]
MEQYEPERLTPPQAAALRRGLRGGRAALTRRSLLRAATGGALA